MSTEVFYRKWRPRAFAELAGQESVVRALTNAIAAGKVAHAYLFSGPRGTGKTTSGRLLAKALNCAKPKKGEACNTCASCQAYLSGRALDLIELDAASNRGIDEIRSLREKAGFVPTAGADAYKVYLVDEVHMLTEPAFNALLKTLEEPPPHVVFVLATTEVHKVPPTVASRCQRFDFRRIPLAASVERLSHIAAEEEIECPQEALEQIARSATGSLRDAENLLEQFVASYGKTLSTEQVQEGLGLVTDARSGELSAHALKGELGPGLALIASVRDDGLDLRQFQRQVVAHMRGLLLTKADASSADVWSEEQIAEMRALVADVPTERIVAALRAFGEADLRADPLSSLPLELALAGSILAEATAPAVSTRPELSTAPKRQQATEPKRAPERPKATKVPATETAKNGEADATEVAEKAPATETAKNGGAEAAEVADKPPAAAASASKTPQSSAKGEVAPQLAEARDRWPEIVQRARELHYRTGALLNSGCGIIQASDDEIVFGFRHSIHLDRMQADGGENLQALQQAVDEALRPGRTVRCVLEPDVELYRRGGHLVRAAEELGGEVLTDEG